MSTAVLIPVMRPHKIAGLIENIEAVTPMPHAVYWAATAGSECERTLNELHASVLVDGAAPGAPASMRCLPSPPSHTCSSAPTTCSSIPVGSRRP